MNSFKSGQNAGHGLDIIPNKKKGMPRITQIFTKREERQAIDYHRLPD